MAWAACCALHTTVVEVGCHAFVPLIEAGNFDDPRHSGSGNAYLKPCLKPGGSIVLGLYPTTPC